MRRFSARLSAARLKPGATILVAAAILVAASLFAACSTRSEAPAPAASAPIAREPRPEASAMSGQVVGTVSGLSAGSPIVVALEPRTARTFPPQDEKPVMDQVGQTFGPELLVVRTGQPVEFRNSDDTLHNVHVSHDETHEPAFNVAIPTGASYTYTFPRDGFYRVGCDIHPSMSASIYATTTPFAQVAAPDGRFSFEGVPNGAWTLKAFGGGRRMQRDVDVRGAVVQVALESGVE